MLKSMTEVSDRRHTSRTDRGEEHFCSTGKRTYPPLPNRFIPRRSYFTVYRFYSFKLLNASSEGMPLQSPPQKSNSPMSTSLSGSVHEHFRCVGTISLPRKCQENHCFVVFRESPTEHNFYVGDGFLTPFNPAAHAKSKL